MRSPKDPSFWCSLPTLVTLKKSINNKNPDYGNKWLTFISVVYPLIHCYSSVQPFISVNEIDTFAGNPVYIPGSIPTYDILIAVSQPTDSALCSDDNIGRKRRQGSLTGIHLTLRYFHKYFLKKPIKCLQKDSVCVGGVCVCLGCVCDSIKINFLSLLDTKINTTSLKLHRPMLLQPMIETIQKNWGTPTKQGKSDILGRMIMGFWYLYECSQLSR